MFGVTFLLLSFCIRTQCRPCKVRSQAEIDEREGDVCFSNWIVRGCNLFSVATLFVFRLAVCNWNVVFDFSVPLLTTVDLVMFADLFTSITADFYIYYLEGVRERGHKNLNVTPATNHDEEYTSRQPFGGAIAMHRTYSINATNDWWDSETSI